MSDSLFGNLFPQSNNKEEETISVSRLNALVKNKLELLFSHVSVHGEVSNLRIPASGHAYFTIKDDYSEVSAVCFRRNYLKKTETLKDGQKIVVHARVSLYEARGSYQLIVENMQTRGIGDLRARFDKLVLQLKNEGLFDEVHKKELPRFPQRIGIITSATGAAIQDIQHMIFSRWSGAHVILGPVAVQGDKAASEISRMIDFFNTNHIADVLIVGRGGGSLEDLWPFNEECVARAIFRSDIPVISAVGHEIDTTIADMVADKRALTPTKAGEMVVPDEIQENQRLDDWHERMKNAFLLGLERKKQRLGLYRSHRVFAVPRYIFKQRYSACRDIGMHMRERVRERLRVVGTKLSGSSKHLEGLNPLSVLHRGFSYTTTETGISLKSSDDIEIGATLITRLNSGMVYSAVTGKEE